MPTSTLGTFGSQGISANTRFPVFGMASLNVPTVEAQAATPVRFAGSVVGVYLYVAPNTTTGSSTLTLRQNGGSTGLAVSVGAGATGSFEDTSTTISVANTDTLNWQFVPGGGGTITLQLITTRFVTSDEPHVSILTSTGTANISSNSSTTVLAPFGFFATTVAEANASWFVKLKGTLSNLSSYISANSRITSTTIASRINGASGAESFSVGASSTGAFEDATNTDAIDEGQLVTIQVVTSTGGGTITAVRLGYNFRSTNKSILWAITQTGVFGASTIYNPGLGGIVNNTTQAGGTFTFRADYHLTRFLVYVELSQLDTSTAVSTLKNNVATAIAISIPATTTGQFTDDVDDAQVVAGDTWTVKMVFGGTGAQLIRVNQIGLLASDHKTFILIPGR